MPSYHSNIHRLQNEIASLQKDDAALSSKEASAMKRSHSAGEATAKTKSSSTLKLKLREAERAATELANLAKKRADVAKKLAAKRKDLSAYEGKQGKEDERSRAKVAAEQKKLLKQNEDRTRNLNRELTKMASAPQATHTLEQEFDFFISHASEDKAEFVASLAAELTALGCEVFYDAATLKIGDSLRRSIDAGLRNSRYGVVILSTAFFRKEWPARELDGLTALEVDGRARILPIWHKVSKDEVANYSPVLADKVALNTSTQGVKEIAAALQQLL